MKRPGIYILAAWLAVLISIGLPGVAAAQHFQCTPTETSHSVLIDDAVINGFPLEPGDEIGIMSTLNSGLCCGFATYDGNPIGISAWGDDPNTPEVDGFMSDEEMAFLLYRQNTESEYIVNLWNVEGPTSWTPDAISTIEFAWANDYDRGTGIGVPVVNVLDFGTIGDLGEEHQWYLHGGLMNVGDAPLVVLNGTAVNGSFEFTNLQNPCVLPNDHMYEFSVMCRGDSPFEDELIINTSEGPVSFDVRADIHPDGAPFHYPMPTNTGTNFSLLIEDYTVFDTPPMYGDEIAVYGATNNILAGWAFVDDYFFYDNPVGISVWGDDPNTPEIDGLLPGEQMVVEISRPTNNCWDITSIATWSGFNGTYSADGAGSATCEAEDYSELGAVQAVARGRIDFLGTKNGYSRYDYGQVNNTSTEGWVYVQPLNENPSDVFGAEFWSFTGALPPSSSGITVHRFSPDGDQTYEGSTSHKWIDANGEGVYVVEAEGVGHGDWYWYVENTGSNHSVIVENAELNGWHLDPGDEIGFITVDGDGIVRGVAGNECHFPWGAALWGDDPTTPEIDGFLAGDPIGARIYDHSHDQEFWALVEIQSGPDVWQPDGISVIDVYNIPIPWDFSVFNDQSIFENEWFDPIPLDDAIVGGLPEGWGPGGFGTMLDEIDPDSIDWTASIISEPVNGLNLECNITDDRMFNVAVPDSEWVGAQFIRLYAMDQYGQQDSVDLNYEVQQINDPPSAFDLISLPDGEEIDYQDPTLMWHSAPDVDWTNDEVTYVLQWGFDLEWPNNHSEATGTDTTFQFTEAAIMTAYREQVADSQLDELVPDEATIFWRVLANDGNDGQTISGPDEYWTFDVHINDLPSAFSLLSPADEETLAFIDPPIYTFSWEESVDPDPEANVVYNLYVDLPDFAPYMVEVNGTSEDVNFYDDAGMAPWIGYLNFSWWVEAISEGDTIQCNEPFEATVESTSGVGEELFAGIPKTFVIESIYPNPFNPSTKIVVGLAEPGFLTVEVYNMLGQKVATLAESAQDAGYKHFTFDGNHLSSGLYFVRANVPNKMNEIRRVILMR